MRHRLYLRAYFNRRDPGHGQAKIYDPPDEPEKVLDTEHNEVIAPEGLGKRTITRRLYRAMIKGWKSFTPYS